MPFDFKDNTPIAKSQMERNIAKALEMMGLKNQEIVTKIMSDPNYYGLNRDIIDAGRLRSSMSYQVDAPNQRVIVGTNVEYAIWVHEGTLRMKGRPFLKDSIFNYREDYKEIAKSVLGEGYDK